MSALTPTQLKYLKATDQVVWCSAGTICVNVHGHRRSVRQTSAALSLLCKMGLATWRFHPSGQTQYCRTPEGTAVLEGCK